MKIKSIQDLKELHIKKSIQFKDKHRMISVCGGTGCRASKALDVLAAFKKELKTLDETVILKETGCHGFCEKGPLVVIRPEDIFYQQVTPEDVPEIIEKTIIKGEIIDSLLFEIPETKKKIIKEHDVPFYKGQERIVFGYNGYIDPENIDDYIGMGGYTALGKALTKMQPDNVISEIEKSGLRGRGGGGFLTGKKWRSCSNAKHEHKYVICNADEGDPGAFMDRSIVEGNPHSVLEGMIIGAYAIGASEGYVYIRTEYPLAVLRLEHAITKAREMGLLGKQIIGTNFDFDIFIARGSGAFVCGESSALIASIEGKPGEPRAKHIHMTESGLFGKPTTLNNVETWANIPFIINKGSDWFSSIGTENSKGTKVFSLVGQVNLTGLVEVPMGITINEVVNGIGGGVPKGRKLKAVQTGGPSGGCIPTSMMDLPVDFDSLTAVGSMMGSGGLIVMDDRTCMVDVAKYFTGFLVEESCGKCNSCREGLKHMVEVLTRICCGNGKNGDIELLEDLCDIIGSASLCGLGTSAPNPVKSTLKYFRNEYIAHILDKKCPAKVCTALIEYSIIDEKCKKCGLCLKHCPAGAISGEKKQIPLLDQSKCTKCGICVNKCKFEAINVN
ncbi:MAG TPA: NADH-ubiquinone oxidoreductase-F iron-sulfur binding region domain-containing protein [Victivallales bacterium]|nr:NADH-ubiquinone oxidoreductase-F iron-sulfur binding region domain-containing protein [Victivallales bacterium]